MFIMGRSAMVIIKGSENFIIYNTANSYLNIIIIDIIGIEQNNIDL